MTYQELFLYPLIQHNPVVESLRTAQPSVLLDLHSYLAYAVLMALLPQTPKEEHRTLAQLLTTQSGEQLQNWYNSRTIEEQNLIVETLERAVLALKTI